MTTQLVVCLALPVPPAGVGPDAGDGGQYAPVRLFVERAHAAGLALNVWTVNALDDLRAVVAWGADAVITDRLDDALAIARGDRD